jgi:Holin of 3TMs, for gene-transfer release
MPLLDTIFGGGVGKLVKEVVGTFKLDPEKKAEFQAAVDANQAALALKELEIQGKIQDAISQEVASSAEIIKAEAQSQSWLPRNVRPLLLLLWGLLITLNFLIPLIAKVTGVVIEPLVLDPWVYRLTIIGYTGYVGFRTFEKIKDADK